MTDFAPVLPPGDLDQTTLSDVRLVRNMRVVFDSGLFPPLYENMTPTTKPEVSHCRQIRMDSRLRMTCIENLVKFGRVVYENCERTDSTDRQRR